jgi:hypothetical protein
MGGGNSSRSYGHRPGKDGSRGTTTALILEHEHVPFVGVDSPEPRSVKMRHRQPPLSRT